MLVHISQELFDENLLESQELFEYSDDQAVQETISELQSSSSSSSSTENLFLDHLSLTHPNSKQGKEDRAKQAKFVQALKDYKEKNGNDNFSSIQIATEMINTTKNNDNKELPMFLSLVLQNGFFAVNSSALSVFFANNNNTDQENNSSSSSSLEQQLDFTLSLLTAAAAATSTSTTTTTTHALAREIKLQLAWPVQEHQWCALYEKTLNSISPSSSSLQIKLLQWARTICNACESNKKTFMRAAIDYRPKHGRGNDNDNDNDNNNSNDTTNTITSAASNGVEMLINSIPIQINEDTIQLAIEMSKLITILGKFQATSEPLPKDGQEPLVSSAHANVKELYKAGAVNRLHLLAKQCTNDVIGSGDGGSRWKDEGNENNDDENNKQLLLLCDVLSALRVMAIDNDIVQNMVAVGILETADASLMTQEQIPAPLAAATLGLFRNLCANDEIKSSVCRKSLLAILHAMETHPMTHSVQEHGCGILGAMALRQPRNALAIIGCSSNSNNSDDGDDDNESNYNNNDGGGVNSDDNNNNNNNVNGVEYILKAMQNFPNKVPLQRQGCLAIRNIASRLSPEQKQIILDAGAENILKTIPSMHQGSVEEAYAALRDLGITAVMYKYDENGQAQTTQLFGTVKSNFRPVYD